MLDNVENLEELNSFNEFKGLQSPVTLFQFLKTFATLIFRYSSYFDNFLNSKILFIYVNILQLSFYQYVCRNIFEEKEYVLLKWNFK